MSQRSATASSGQPLSTALHDRTEMAVATLVDARRSGQQLDELPLAFRPSTMDEALAIQDAATRTLGEKVRGWKVFSPPGESLARGGLLASRFMESPATFDAKLVPLLGIEGEIAFMLRADLPARERAYERDEIAKVASACAAIEILSSRYRDFNKVTLYERIADHFLNGAFVHGAPVDDWSGLDLNNAEVSLEVDGKVLVANKGGHPTVDPILPVAALANHFRSGRGMRAGEFITTGSFTGLTFLKPGQQATVTVKGLGAAQARFI